MEPRLDQPYDKAFKSLAEDEALLVLRHFAGVPAEAIAGIEHLPREITPRAPEIDHAYRLTVGGEAMIVHLEAWTRWQGFIPERALEYGGTLVRKYEIEVRTVVLVLRDDGPEPVNSAARCVGGYREEYDYEVVKLWEIPAEDVMGIDCRRLWAWVPLMRHNDEQLRQCARRVVEDGDEKLQAEFVINGGLRYDRDWLRALLRSFKPMITMDIYAESSVTRDHYLRALSKGRAEGRAEGALEALRTSLRGFLAARFPGLEEMPEIAAISDPAELNRISHRVFLAGSAAEARDILRSRNRE